MARKKKSTALATYDEQLAALAQAAAEQEASTGGGTFFSIRGGTLKLNDSPLPNNEMAVVIIDSILENTYYEGDFNTDEPQAPSCFGFGRSDEELAPHESVKVKQADACAECPHAEWGSSDRGRGKACRNRRRLALIPAGVFDKNGEFEPEANAGHFANAPVAYLALPPTSINNFGAYVKKVAATLKRPPFAVITKIRVVPDEKTQLKVLFELIDSVPTDAIEALIGRNNAEKEVIDFPYAAASEETGGKKKKTKKKSKRGRKY